MGWLLCADGVQLGVYDTAGTWRRQLMEATTGYDSLIQDRCDGLIQDHLLSDRCVVTV